MAKKELQGKVEVLFQNILEQPLSIRFDLIVSAMAMNHVEVPANTVLPILLTFSSESSTDKLVTAVIDDMMTKYFINP